MVQILHFASNRAPISVKACSYVPQPPHTHWCRINGCLVRLVTHSRIISETSSYSKSACDLFYCTWIGRECVFTNLLPMCSHRCHSHDFNLESRWGFGIHNFPKCYDDHFQCVLASKQHIYPRVKRVKMNFLAMVFVVNHILSWPILGQSVKDISIHFFLSGWDRHGMTQNQMGRMVKFIGFRWPRSSWMIGRVSHQRWTFDLLLLAAPQCFAANLRLKTFRHPVWLTFWHQSVSRPLKRGRDVKGGQLSIKLITLSRPGSFPRKSMEHVFRSWALKASLNATVLGFLLACGVGSGKHGLRLTGAVCQAFAREHRRWGRWHWE